MVVKRFLWCLLVCVAGLISSACKVPESTTRIACEQILNEAAPPSDMQSAEIMMWPIGSWASDRSAGFDLVVTGRCWEVHALVSLIHASMRTEPNSWMEIEEVNDKGNLPVRLHGAPHVDHPEPHYTPFYSVQRAGRTWSILRVGGQMDWSERVHLGREYRVRIKPRPEYERIASGSWSPDGESHTTNIDSKWRSFTMSNHKISKTDKPVFCNKEELNLEGLRARQSASSP